LIYRVVRTCKQEGSKVVALHEDLLVEAKKWVIRIYRKEMEQTRRLKREEVVIDGLRQFYNSTPEFTQG
jgi:hypothetical protein